MNHAFRTNPRKRLTNQQRVELFLDRGGQCHKCGRVIRAGEKWIDEHLIALENGGTNEWENRVLSCEFCKPSKDAEDHRQAAKTRHVATSHFLPQDQKRKKGRPMMGTKASGWKKKIDGTVERR